MDLGAVATSLSGLLAPALPFLLGIGGAISQRAGDEVQERLGDLGASRLRAFWEERLWPMLKSDPSARLAVEQATLDPEDEEHLLALTLKLQRLLDEDSQLAESARRLIAESASFQASNGGVSAQEISDSNVVTGSGNVVQKGGTNVNFHSARNVSIRDEVEGS